MGKFLRRTSGRGYYGRIFFSMIISIVATIVILSMILYLNFEKIVLLQSYSQTMDRLAQTSQEASVMSVSASTFAKQIYNDQHVAKLLNYMEVSPVDVITSIKQLNNYRETSPFIDSIYVYNAKTGTFYISTNMSVHAVYTEEDFYDREMVSMVKDVDRFEPMMPIPRKLKIEGLTSNNAEKVRDTYTFLLYDTLLKSDSKNVIVVNVKETQLHKHIDGAFTNAVDNTFLIDTSGRLVSNSWMYPMLSDLSSKTYIQPILDHANEPGYYAGDVEGEHSFVTYSATDYLGWRYIRIVPYDVITEKINDMRNNTIWIAGIILLFGLGVSYLVSRILFRALNGKLARLSSLEIDRRDSFQMMRRWNIRNLLLGMEKTSSEKIRASWQRLGIDIETESNFRVIILKIDRYREFAEEFGSEDRKLYRFGVMNIAEEIFAVAYRVYATEIGEDSIALLLTNLDAAIYQDHQLIEDENQLIDSLKQIQLSTKEYLKLTVTASLSASGENIRSIHHLYEQALEGSYHRLFRGRESIIDAQSVELNKAKKYQYPIQREKQLIDELMLGRLHEVKRLLLTIINETAEYSYVSFQLAFSRLSFALNKAVQTIRQNVGSSDDQEAPNLPILTYDQIETLDELTERYYEVLDTLFRQLEERKRTKYDEMTERVIEMIDTRYMDPELSLDVIADDLELSATYIGRIFKQHTMKTILGYIIEVRMNRVRALLAHTEDSIGEIAEKTGFSNSPYFYKAFKKINGVTPAEYRKYGRNTVTNDDNETFLA